MKFKPYKIEDAIKITEMYTLFTYSYDNTYVFSGETHDFWEFVCVDKGSVNICMDDKELTLHKGEIAFHQPNEFHNVSTYSQIAPNLVVISFKCNSPLMDFFRQRVLKIDEKERSLLAKILVEAQNLFETPLNNPYTKEMLKKKNVPVGSEQFIRMYLECFLLGLIRRYSLSEQQLQLPVTKSSADIFKRV